MRHLHFVLAVGIATALLTGCSTVPGPEDSGYPRVEVGDETVFLVPVDQFARPLADVEALVSAVPVIVVGTVVAVDDIAAEVSPNPDREGVLPGDGEDLYGTITFKVSSVIKGDIKGDVISVGYLSGKRNEPGSRVRLSYQYDGLTAFQDDTGGLRPAMDHAGRSYVVFAKPNPGSVPLAAASHIPAVVYGIAELEGNHLRFGEDGTLVPVMQNGRPTVISLEDLIAAAQ